MSGCPAMQNRPHGIRPSDGGFSRRHKNQPVFMTREFTASLGDTYLLFQCLPIIVCQESGCNAPVFVSEKGHSFSDHKNI
jgi:hypothetical protein